jgi:hypothetical protein
MRIERDDEAGVVRFLADDQYDPADMVFMGSAIQGVRRGKKSVLRPEYGPGGSFPGEDPAIMISGIWIELPEVNGDELVAALFPSRLPTR